MRLVRVASGSATPTVVMMVGSGCAGMPLALTQEAAVCSATEPFGNPVPGGRAAVKAACRRTAGTALSGEVGDDR